MPGALRGEANRREMNAVVSSSGNAVDAAFSAMINPVQGRFFVVLRTADGRLTKDFNYTKSAAQSASFVKLFEDQTDVP